MASKDFISSDPVFSSDLPYELRQSFDRLTLAAAAFKALLDCADDACSESSYIPPWLIASRALFQPVLDSISHQDTLFVQHVIPALQKGAEK